MHLITALRWGFAFFIFSNISWQVLYVIGDVVERYEQITLDKTDANFCNDICAISGAAERYGTNVAACLTTCKSKTNWPLIRATKLAVENYHLCGIDTPCLDAFFGFARSLTGGATIVLGMLLTAQFASTIWSAGPMAIFGTGRRRPAYRPDPRSTVSVTDLSTIPDNDNEQFLSTARRQIALEAPPTWWQTVRDAPKALMRRTHDE